MNLDDILLKECTKGIYCKWGTFKNELFPPLGIKILQDYSGIDDNELISGPDAASTLKNKCQFDYDEMLLVNTWREEFQRLNDNKPLPNDVIYTVDGSPVKLTIEFYPDKEPFIYARIYVPDKVGDELGWFAQSIKEPKMYGLKVILWPKSRNEVLRRLGATKNEVGVTSIRILKASFTGKSLSGEVAEW